MADLVRLTKNGIRIKLSGPNNNMASSVSKYPIKLGLYSTIELDTASQNGHFTLVDLYKDAHVSN